MDGSELLQEGMNVQGHMVVGPYRDIGMQNLEVPNIFNHILLVNSYPRGAHCPEACYAGRREKGHSMIEDFSQMACSFGRTMAGTVSPHRYKSNRKVDSGHGSPFCRLQRSSLAFAEPLGDGVDPGRGISLLDDVLDPFH